MSRDYQVERLVNGVSLAHAARPHPHALLHSGSNAFVEEICIEESYGLQAYLQILDKDCEVLSYLTAAQKLPDLASQRAAWVAPELELVLTGLDVPQFGAIHWMGRYKSVAGRQMSVLLVATKVGKKVKRFMQSILNRLPPLPFDRHVAAITLWIVEGTSSSGAVVQKRFSFLPVIGDAEGADPFPCLRVSMHSSHSFVSWARRRALGCVHSSKRSSSLAIGNGASNEMAHALIEKDEPGHVPSVSRFPGRTTEVQMWGDSEDGRDWPRISVVTVSYNQGRYLRACLESVLDQNYPNLDYVVIDGGSTDGSREILECYRHRLSHLVIEPDRGQSHALNKGFMLASGDVMTWLCSDDRLEAGSLEMVAKTQFYTSCDMIVGGCRVIDGMGRTKQIHHSGFITGQLSPLSFGDLASFTSTWLSGLYFYQPEVFFTRDLWNRAGGHVKEHLHYAMDYEMFLRFALSGASLFAVDQVLASSRQHEEQKTRHELPMYLPTVEQILRDFRRLLGALQQA
ncbi:MULTISPECIES: glycosyltransferase family 2 protein [unclassified Synechococcus]|uniref:glycosyltransferase family 2 protein n=1 Tax=unclassified Synechococcus TaxID=2626047 RepID=UPI0021A32E67|nr:MULTISPECIES: glycosyltransferase family 2 protein [unclassified Synechococcus]MCT0213139.1 glycosyltransferase [Synechococcus sp. CS-1326]MCT0233027.1 glycosyltransferase [Synechococcus sp. CS-1327]